MLGNRRGLDEAGPRTSFRAVRNKLHLQLAGCKVDRRGVWVDHTVINTRATDERVYLPTFSISSAASPSKE
jgi:hypothetical protein